MASITGLKDSDKKQWTAVEALQVSVRALEDDGEDVDQDVLDSIASLQPEEGTEGVAPKTPENSTASDTIYDKAVMVVQGSKDGLKQKDLRSILDCSEYRLGGIRERMVEEGIAFNPNGGKIYPMVDGHPRGYIDHAKTARPKTRKKASDAIMAIDVPVVDKTVSDITQMIRNNGVPTTNAVVKGVLDEMVSDGLVASKPHPKYKGRVIYSF